MESEDLPIPIDRSNTNIFYIHNSFNYDFQLVMAMDVVHVVHIKPSSAYLACTNWRSVVAVRRGARILLYLFSNESVAVLELVAR